MDFFDGAHQVVVRSFDFSWAGMKLTTFQMGGSYATIPRIAGRRSVRNWYQRNYPYPWVGGRIVYDM